MKQASKQSGKQASITPGKSASVLAGKSGRRFQASRLAVTRAGQHASRQSRKNARMPAKTAQEALRVLKFSGGVPATARPAETELAFAAAL